MLRARKLCHVSCSNAVFQRLYFLNCFSEWLASVVLQRHSRDIIATGVKVVPSKPGERLGACDPRDKAAPFCVAVGVTQRGDR